MWGSAKVACPRTTFIERSFLVTDNEEVAPLPCFPSLAPAQPGRPLPQGYFSNRSSRTDPESPTAPLTSDLPAAAPRRGTPKKNGAGWQGWVSVQLWA